MVTLLKNNKASRISLIMTWLVTAITMFVLLLVDVRNTGQFGVVRHTLHGMYVLALLWHLWRPEPSTVQSSRTPSLSFPQGKYAGLIPAVGLALILMLHIVSDDVHSILVLLLIAAAVWILIAWYRRIRVRMLISSIAIAITALLGGLPFLADNFISRFPFIIFLALMPPMFTAGWLLVEHTNLSDIQIIRKGFKHALKSFLWGCLLFIPLGLANAASGSPGPGFTWVNQWWMPVSLPLFSGITEEVMYRLVLVTLCYMLLLPAFRNRTVFALMAAVLFSAITFGLGHGRTVHNFLTTGLLYGLPLAVVFAKRDWEHAVGAHYMINMLPWLMVFLSA